MGARGGLQPPTILWLKGFFDRVGEVSGYEFYQFIQAEVQRLQGEQSAASSEPLRRIIQREIDLRRAVSYDRIRYYIWMLNKVRAIRFVREEPGAYGKPKRYYIKVDDYWFKPGLQSHFYPAVGLGGQRYRSFVERRQAPFIKPTPRGKVVPNRPYTRWWEQAPRPKDTLPRRSKRGQRKKPAAHRRGTAQKPAENPGTSA